jgi:putative methionine-R-sulfoxide reductase with GAF domain
MDSPVLNRFKEDDEKQLIELLDILIDNSDITAISNYYQKS